MGAGLHEMKAMARPRKRDMTKMAMMTIIRAHRRLRCCVVMATSSTTELRSDWSKGQASSKVCRPSERPLDESSE